MSKNHAVLCNLSLVSLLAFTAACSDPKVNKSSSKALTTVEASKLIDAGNNEEGAEVYARMGEILLTKAEGTVYAEAMFAKSLEAHSFNNKANLYSAVLGPAMTLKGYVSRAKPLATDEYSKEALKELEQRIRASEIKEFIDFALVPKADKKQMMKMDDVRKFLRNEYAIELKNSLEKLDKVKSDVVLNFSNSPMKKRYESGQSCDSGVDQCVQQISFSAAPSTIRIDSYDLKALKILLKTQRSALLIASSIGLNGYEELSDMAEKGKIGSDRDAVAAIKSIPELLKIEGSKDDLREIFDHSEEVMNDLIDFSKISAKICNMESRSSNAFESICVSEMAAEKINEILLFVAGPKSLVLGKNEQGEDVMVEVDLKALINSNVSSLQELLPNKFDSKGRAIDLKDHTFAGIIPNGDLLSKLKTVVR